VLPINVGFFLVILQPSLQRINILSLKAQNSTQAASNLFLSSAAKTPAAKESAAKKAVKSPKKNQH
jgi:hypothetical protein